MHNVPNSFNAKFLLVHLGAMKRKANIRKLSELTINYPQFCVCIEKFYKKNTQYTYPYVPYVLCTYSGAAQRYDGTVMTVT